jgi:hypothetical protein
MATFSGPRIPRSGLLLHVDAASYSSVFGPNLLNGSSSGKFNDATDFRVNQDVTISQVSGAVRVVCNQSSSTPGAWPIGTGNGWLSVNANTKYIVRTKAAKTGGGTANLYVSGNLSGNLVWTGATIPTDEPGWVYSVFDTGSNTSIKPGILWSTAATNSELLIESFGIHMMRAHDMTGNDYHGTMGSNFAAVSINEQSGRPFTWRLDGRSDQSILFNYAALDLRSSDHTVIGMSRYAGNLGQGDIRGRIIQSYQNNWLLGHWSSGSEEHYAAGWIRAGTPNTTNWGCYVATRDHSADYSSFYVNDTAIVTNSTAGSAGPNKFQIGRYNSNTTEHSSCDFAAMLVYNRVLSRPELTYVYNVYKDRFNL